MNETSSESKMTIDEAHRILSRPARRIMKLVIEREKGHEIDESLPFHTVSSLAREYKMGPRMRKKKGASYSFLWRNVKPLIKAGFLEGTLTKAGNPRRFELRLGPLVRKRESKAIKIERRRKVKR